MSDYPYSFEAEIVARPLGGVQFSVVYVPRAVTDQLDFSRGNRLRIDGEINEARFEAALMPSKGQWYIVVSKKLQKKCGAVVGKKVTIAFEIADSDAVEVPNELQFALEANEDAMKVWQTWTAGRRRGCCYRVASAKRIETKERRVEDVISMLLDSTES